MSTLLSQAIAAHQAGRLVEAEKSYRAVLAHDPSQPDALALLGVVRGALGDAAEAEALLTQAIAQDPQAALFPFHLGNVLMEAKRLPEAAAAFRQAIALQPGFAQAYYNLGNALRAAGVWGEAVVAYRQGLAFQPAYAEAWQNLALGLVHEKQYDEALRAAQKAVAVAPEYGEGWRTLCSIAEQVKAYPQALTAGEVCVRLLPDHYSSWFGYAVALNRLNRHEEALPAYERALALKPDRADIWDNLGQTYQSLGRLDEAEATFRKTVEVAGQVIEGEGSRVVAEEEYGNRHWHLALVELLRGHYPAGFARYRSRFKDVGGLARPNFSRPVWKGEDLKGKTILVCDEQGFGDTLMLARYLPLMKARGARIIFSVHKVLMPLFQGWAGADEIITYGERVGAYDYYASVFDLPYCFGTTLETVPQDVPYLPVPSLEKKGIPACAGMTLSSENTVCQSDRHARAGGHPLISVGVVWGGSPIHSNDLKRSIPLSVFKSLFELPNVAFFSFNRDKREGDDALLATLPVTDLTSHLTDFAAAARIVQQMDLIITCDTATAHLAGGLGIPVWVLLPFSPDWRWLTGRTDNPWYPTARLFRQESDGDWEGVLRRVADALTLFRNEERQDVQSR